MFISLLRVLIAAIITSIVFAFVNIGFTDYPNVKELISSYCFFIIYLTIFFFFLGIVISKLINEICEGTKLNRYFIGLVLYSGVALLVPFFTFHTYLESIFWFGIIPVLTFFHLLILVKKVVKNKMLLLFLLH